MMREVGGETDVKRPLSAGSVLGSRCMLLSGVLAPVPVRVCGAARGASVALLTP